MVFSCLKFFLSMQIASNVPILIFNLNNHIIYINNMILFIIK